MCGEQAHLPHIGTKPALGFLLKGDLARMCLVRVVLNLAPEAAKRARSEGDAEDVESVGRGLGVEQKYVMVAKEARCALALLSVPPNHFIVEVV